MQLLNGLWTVTGSARRLAVSLAVLAAAAALLIWMAPAEKTLGDGIKWVYVHVAFTWAGMTALAIAGVLGVALLITGRAGLSGWTRSVGLVGLAFFAMGWALSLAASAVNWGGVFWAEPRNQVNVQVVAAGVVIAVVDVWLGHPRWQGVLFALLFVWMMVAFNATPLILHPRDPIFSSSAVGIQAAFLGMYLLCGLAALAVILYWRRPQP